VTYNQTVVPCRPKEYTLLELFLRSPQRLLSRSSIIDHLWTFDDAPVEGSVTTLVKDLRRRLKAAGMEQDPIETVYGLGYRLKPAPVNRSIPSNENLGSLEEAVSRSREDSKTQRLQVVLQNVRANFRASWAQRLGDLEQAEHAFQRGDFDPDRLQQALTQVHKLAGGLGTFGYGEASKIAEMLEQLLSVQTRQQSQWVEQFSELLQQLNDELANLPEPEASQLPLVEAGQGK
jgi:DNA-binding winged helix-turn-helix (wHTH) protein